MSQANLTLALTIKQTKLKHNNMLVNKLVSLGLNLIKYIIYYYMFMCIDV